MPTALLLAAEADAGTIRAKVGIFFASLVAGCSCADDPTSGDEQAEYCEALVEIDRETAAARVTLPEG